MAKPSKKTIEPLLDEWARLEHKARRIRNQRDLQIAPQTLAYEKKCAPILFDAKQRLSPIEQRQKEITNEITKQMELGIDREAETVALTQVVIEAEVSRGTLTAIAEVQIEDGNREIDPVKFLAEFPEAKRDGLFWKCLKVLVGPAEKAYGDLVNRISKKPKVYKVKVFVPEAAQEKKKAA